MLQSKALFIVPYLRQQREGAVEEKREEEKERLSARRLAALDEIQLMSNSAQTIIEQEETLFMQYINATIEYDSFLTLGETRKIIFKYVFKKHLLVEATEVLSL